METTIGQVRGVKCRIPALDADLDQAAKIEIVSSQMGGQNCHVDAEFEDGVTWIVRIRLANPTMPPQKVQDEILLSEVATLKFLGQTAVPVPEVYYHQLQSENDTAGASFIVMEKLPGRVLEWNETNSEQREKIMEQLATFFLELEKYPFEKTGSIISIKSGFDIGPHAQLPFFESPTSRLGPWSDLNNAYLAIIQRQLQAIDCKEIASLPEENRGYFQWLLSALPSVLGSTKTATGPFYLKHFDDKGDHILIDEQYNITGIIDWEFASTESKNLAFSTPCMMWPVENFYDGKNDLSQDELRFAQIFKQHGRHDIADIVLGCRPWQRSSFLPWCVAKGYRGIRQIISWSAKIFSTTCVAVKVSDSFCTLVSSSWERM